ncbi:hypothetical protein IMZ48_18555 [Candidatus Bathyarchaeota archaeon]|nr:hypothetical protein [Candidatus Bathyarchaeota archaeon]
MPQDNGAIDGEVEKEFHYTSHGYTSSKHDYTLREAVATPRGGRSSGKVVWAVGDVEEWKESPVGYSYLGE